MFIFSLTALKLNACIETFYKFPVGVFLQVVHFLLLLLINPHDARAICSRENTEIDIIYGYTYFRLMIGICENPETPSWKGYVVATGLLVVKFTMVFSNRHLHGIFNVNLNLRVRSALTAVVYKKVKQNRYNYMYIASHLRKKSSGLSLNGCFDINLE